MLIEQEAISKAKCEHHTMCEQHTTWEGQLCLTQHAQVFNGSGRVITGPLGQERLMVDGGHETFEERQARLLFCGLTSIRREREKETKEIKAAYLVLPSEHLEDSVEMCVPFTMPRIHQHAGEWMTNANYQLSFLFHPFLA